MLFTIRKKALILWIALLAAGMAACESLPDLPRPADTVGGLLQQTEAPSIAVPATVIASGVPASTPAAEILPTSTETPIPSPTPLEAIHFAVIGDYGLGTQPELDVANLVKSWNPEFIITVGDNNHPIGAAETIDQRIGEYYHEYIYPYRGAYGEGAERNRFFPTLGNHDYDSVNGQPYMDYFELPGNERYYDFSWGPVYFLALDSDSRTPDGVSQVSTQAKWAQSHLAEAAQPWKVVYFHASPYSSGIHGPVDWMQWPFADWGASTVLAGHNHVYERLEIGGIPYFTHGVGGGPIYDFVVISEGSQFRYNDDYGAMLVTADARQMLIQFFTRNGELIDSHLLAKSE